MIPLLTSSQMRALDKHAIDEIGKRFALGTQGADRRSDRILTCRAARDVCICAVECEIGLI